MSLLGEPAFEATREEAAAFFRTTPESSWRVLTGYEDGRNVYNAALWTK